VTSQRRSGAHSRRHLLLVEDEPTLARVLALVLTTAGYTVTSCADGLEALETFRASPDLVDVLVSDVSIPGLSGDRLARALHEIRPHLPMVLMTGYSNMVTPHNARALGVTAFLEKPVDIDDLLAALDSVFERARLEA
jgi:DNA-binding NtrC family response regulator